jgi:hypothetical protein
VVIAESGRQGGWSGREREEEGVSLGVDLDAGVFGAGLSHDSAVVGERLVVGLVADLLEQLCRAFDVGEEEGDGAGREVGPHRRFRIMERRRPYVQNLTRAWPLLPA